VRTIAIGPEGLSRSTVHYNCSLAEWRGKTLLAYRDKYWYSDLHIAELDADLRPLGTTPLHPRHPLCQAGREDPRLFVHRGQLHCSFTGIQFADGQTLTHSMLCRLSEVLEVEETWCPEYEGRRFPMEKNWQFFTWQDELFAIYTIRPHVVLYLPHGRKAAYLFSEHAGPSPWAGGRLSGGAAPVLVDDEYYCWFHGSIEDSERGRRVYNIGLYTFEAKPPFRPRRITPVPLLMARAGDRPPSRPHNWADVVFPCGALLRGKEWLVSYGLHDQWCRIIGWDAEAVETSLEKTR
jgi:predicted GH43/DUF377 family glycosyl hydrolase